MKILNEHHTFLLEDIARDVELSTISEANFRLALQITQDWQRGKRDFEVLTSGSTGTPKKIFLVENHIIESIKRTQKAFDLQKGDTLHLCLSLHTVGGFMMLMRSLYLDLDIIVSEPSSNPYHTEWIKKYPITLCSLVPLQISTLLQKDKKLSELDNTNIVLIGGAPLELQTEKQLQATQKRIYHGFGMTETYSHIALRQISPKSETYYKALEGITFSTNEDCLQITDSVTQTTWQTNDIIELIDSKHFNWIGRKDNIINSGGIKTSLERLEQEIRAILAQKEFIQNIVELALFTIEDSKLYQKIIMAVVLNSSLDLFLFKSELKQALPNKYLCPEILVLDAIPLLESGKIDYPMLKTMAKG